MSKEFSEDLDVPEGVALGNWVWGNIIVTPQPNEHTLVDVVGLNLAGEGDIHPQASVKSAYPWVSSGMVGIGTVDGGEGEENSVLWESGEFHQIRIAYQRVNDSETRIHWMVWRDKLPPE